LCCNLIGTGTPSFRLWCRKYEVAVPSQEQLREYVDGDSVHLCILSGQTRGAVSRLGGTEFPIPDPPETGVPDTPQTANSGGGTPPGIGGPDTPRNGVSTPRNA
jgi:hypothetical protein